MSQSEDLKTEVTTVKTKGKTQTASRVQTARKVNSGMFDTPEIVALSLSGAAVLLVICAYFLWLLPARQSFKTSEAERQTAQKKLADLQAQSSESLNNQTAAVDLIGSVERFEINHLTNSATGNAALYGRLNQIIRQNNLRNTAGPEYAPLEIADASRNKLNKGQSLFPGTAVSVTVEGSYQNLRRFISDLENTNQFLIINQVEIESNTEAGGNNSNSNQTQNSPPVAGIPNMNPGISNQMSNPNFNPNFNPNQAARNPNQMPLDGGGQTAAQAAAKRGAVSLRLQMSAYFRRFPNVSPAQTRN